MSLDTVNPFCPTGIALPWLTSLANSFIRGSLRKDEADLARRAVDNLEQLGPTFIKLGQILSIRPDILPPPVMKELAKLQVGYCTLVFLAELMFWLLTEGLESRRVAESAG